MQNVKNKNSDTVLKILSAFVIALMAVVVFFGLFGADKTFDQYGFEDISGDFSADEADFPGLPSSFRGDGVFCATVDPDRTRGRSLCFFSKNAYFDIYLDGIIIYSFHPDLPDVYGKFYGAYPHQVELNDVQDGSVILIKASSINGSKGSFTNIYLENGESYLIKIVSSALFPFCISMLIAIMGIALITGGMSVLKNTDKWKEITAMGLFALDAGIWTSCSSIIAGLATGSAVTMHFVNYISLILIPGLATHFVYVLTGEKYKKSALAILSVCAATLIANIVLSALGVATYHDLLTLTHVECIAAVGYSFICIIKTMREDSKRNTRYIVTAAFIVVTVGGFIDLIRYVSDNAGYDPAYFFRLGLMVFVLILGLNEMYSLLIYRRYEAEAAQMSILAHTDALTGLLNRMAYSEQAERIKNREDQDYIIIQFDVNDLKKVNDNFGHKAGDKHIKAAARIIKDSFGTIGSCYRTGGDEFIAVIENLKDEELFEKAMASFEKKIEAYNDQQHHSIALKIAYGFDKFNSGSVDVESALKTADGRMYLMKKMMKGY